MPATKASVLGATSTESTTEHLREAVVLAAFLTCPSIIEDFESGLETMTCADPTHARLRDMILRHGQDGGAVLHERISDVLGMDALENLVAQRHVAITPCIRNPGNAEMAAMTVAEELAKLSAMRGLSAEIAEAMEDLTGMADEGVTWRLGEAARAADQATRTGQEDKAEYDVGDNGARISRDERSALDALLGNIRYEKPKGRG
jgi:DNA primase